MIRTDVITGGIVTAISAALLAYTTTFTGKPSGSYDIGTKLFPQFLLVSAIALGLFLIFQGIRAKRRVESPGDSSAKPQTVNALIGIVLTAAYLVCIYFGGYFWATPVFIAVLLWVCGIKKVSTILYTSLGFLTFSFVVFYYLLNVPFLTI